MDPQRVLEQPNRLLGRPELQGGGGGEIVELGMMRGERQPAQRPGEPGAQLAAAQRVRGRGGQRRRRADVGRRVETGDVPLELDERPPHGQADDRVERAGALGGNAIRQVGEYDGDLVERGA